LACRFWSLPAVPVPGDSLYVDFASDMGERLVLVVKDRVFNIEECRVTVRCKVARWRLTRLLFGDGASIGLAKEHITENAKTGWQIGCIRRNGSLLPLDE